MRIGCKHSNQQTIRYADFSGGLNTSVAQEMIAANELAVCENMDVDTSTGLLKVVDGNERILTPPAGTTFQRLIYDIINKTFLVVCDNHKLYKADLTAKTITEIGTLTGTAYPVYASWESGVLIASGGLLQYYNGSALTTLDKSPKACMFVYVRSGRVLATDATADNESNIYYSAVGDETTWEDNTNDASTGKWLEVGYKDGGHILALLSMAQDVLIVKSNRCVYRLTGDYPNWSVVEVSRNMDCVGRMAWYNDGINAYIMGQNEIQLLQSDQYYGDVKATNIAVKVASNLQNIVEDGPRMIYISAMNQVWIPLKERYTLVYDATVKAFYMRRWKHEGIVDALAVNKAIFIVRPSSICTVVSHSGYDDGEKMKWRFVAKRSVSANQFLLKKASVNIMPFFSHIIEGNFKIGGIMLELPQPMRAFLLYGNKSRIYHNRQHIFGGDQRAYNLYDTGEEIYENFDGIYHNYAPIYHTAAVSRGTRCVYRNKTITISGTGQGCCFTVNDINYDVAEV